MVWFIKEYEDEYMYIFCNKFSFIIYIVNMILCIYIIIFCKVILDVKCSERISLLILGDLIGVYKSM